jgi:hypothetical protein
MSELIVKNCLKDLDDLAKVDFRNILDFTRRCDLILTTQTVNSITKGALSEKICNLMVHLNQKRQNEIFKNEPKANAFFNCSFMTSLIEHNKNSDNNLEYVQFFEHIKNKETWFIPINTVGEKSSNSNTNRWILCVVEIKKKSLNFYNSLQLPLHLEIYIECLMKLLKFYHDSAEISFNREQWTLVDNSPDDNITDFDESGIFVLFCIDFLSMKVPIFPIPFDMQTYRGILYCAIIRGYMHSSNNHKRNVAAGNISQIVAQKRTRSDYK